MEEENVGKYDEVATTLWSRNFHRNFSIIKLSKSFILKKLDLFLELQLKSQQHKNISFQFLESGR